MKKTIKSFVRRMLYVLHHRKHEKLYKYVMRLNNIPNKPCRGEKEWLEKWQVGGVKISATQYRLFSNYIGENVNIVPEEVSHEIIEPLLNPFRYVGYYTDKNVFDRLFPKGYLPKTLLRRMGGTFYDIDYNRLSLTENKLFQLLASSSSGKVIIKPSIDGMSGRGVQMLRLDSVNLSQLCDNFGNDFIIQEAVEQCDYIGQFNPTSVNTLRLAVYRSIKDDSPHIIAGIMRIGGKGSVVDNAHAGGGYVGINRDGSFCHAVFNQYGQKTQFFNEIDFSANFRYPNWEVVKNFALSIPQFVPHHRLLALDIVLDKEENPHLIEFNVLYYSTWLFQFTTSCAYGEFTDEILEWCKENIERTEYQLTI